MKHYFTLFVLLVCLLKVEAQITIGSNTKPVSGALLELKENDNIGNNSTKGLLLPRVNITTLDNLKADIDIGNQSVESHTGLIVYNPIEHIEQCLIIPQGIYIWNGKQWQAAGSEKIEVVKLEGSLKEELQILKDLRDKYSPHLDQAIPDNNVDNPTPTGNTYISFKELCGEMRVDWINFTDLSNTDKEAIDDVTPLTKIPGLRTLVLDNFKNISTLDLSMARHLNFCSVQNTNLSEIDVSNSYMLRVLQLENTKVSTIDVKQNTLLEALDLNNTKVSEVNVSKNPSLTILRLQNLTNVTTLDLSNNPNIQYLFVNGTKLQRLDLSNNINTEIKTFQFILPGSTSSYFVNGGVKLPTHLKNLFQSVDAGEYYYLYPPKDNSIYTFEP